MPSCDECITASGIATKLNADPQDIKVDQAIGDDYALNLGQAKTLFQYKGVQDVTGSRTIGSSVYTNTESYPIKVYVTTKNATSGSDLMYLIAEVNGNNLQYSEYTYNPNDRASVAFEVLPGETYQVRRGAGSSTDKEWYERRA